MSVGFDVDVDASSDEGGGSYAFVFGGRGPVPLTGGFGTVSPINTFSLSMENEQADAGRDG